MMPSNWWIFPLAMPVVLVVFGLVMLRAMRGVGFSPWRRQDGGADDAEVDGDSDRALSILRQRYARGEIELHEYEERVGPLLQHEPRKILR
jgi:putative membrane protein